MRNWIAYWSTPGFDTAFWERSIEWYVQNLRASVKISADADILDYGSGPGFVGKFLGPCVRSVTLLEPSATLHALSLTINAGPSNVYPIQSETPIAYVARLGQRRFDVVLMNSVLQYIPRHEAPAVMRTLATTLKPGGYLVVSDIIPMGSTLVRELLHVLSFYVRWFSPPAFLRHLVAELRRLPSRRRLDLSAYSQHSFAEAFGRDFAVEWIRNPTICRNRWCAVMTPHS